MAINVSLMIAYPILNSLADSKSKRPYDLIGALFLAAFGFLLCLLWYRRERKYFNDRCNRKPAEVTLGQ